MVASFSNKIIIFKCCARVRWEYDNAELNEDEITDLIYEAKQKRMKRLWRSSVYNKSLIGYFFEC